MRVFDNLLKNYGNWIQVIDDKHDITIEHFDYKTGVQGPITLKHCEKCVAINKYWFKNEKEKKPESYPILGANFLDDFANAVTPGLYHYRCHCIENPIINPKENDISLILQPSKINWFYSDKYDLYLRFGYKDDEKELFIQIISKCIKESYVNGNYKIRKHDKYGVSITLNIDIPGNHEKQGKIYKLVGGYMIFPNGKLKCNTLIGGWQ